MPLREGASSSVISYNIHELMDSWSRTGMIHKDKIRTRKEALRRAVAIALSMARKKPKKPKKKD